MTVENIIIIVLRCNLDHLVLTGLGFSPISNTSGVDSHGLRFCQLFSNSNEKGMTGKAFQNGFEMLAK